MHNSEYWRYRFNTVSIVFRFGLFFVMSFLLSMMKSAHNIQIHNHFGRGDPFWSCLHSFFSVHYWIWLRSLNLLRPGLREADGVRTSACGCTEVLKTCLFFFVGFFFAPPLRFELDLKSIKVSCKSFFSCSSFYLKIKNKNGRFYKAYKNVGKRGNERLDWGALRPEVDHNTDVRTAHIPTKVTPRFTYWSPVPLLFQVSWHYYS